MDGLFKTPDPFLYPQSQKPLPSSGEINESQQVRKPSQAFITATATIATTPPSITYG
jgi:hypothetical protein